MSLADFMEQRVQVITNDGRVVLGSLKGFDHTTNLILSDSFERIISMDQDMETIPLGVYLLRGENVAMVGLVNEELDSEIEWTKIRGEAIPDVVH
ncbi:U6 snRNA-associated Sm-like protein LSm8 [Schizosaccharomyces pombe]|uniref:LSM2-LSM8 complex subunit lsm8 n=1 Tax=Schizosaccharomyces pombe (strain 972 / ATCC 24843) TaxID=284812 RepID=LSM8_SCHPO|nr:putative U6 snRNP-associated protein Lsm8 [Schizosaccharomyces pombe]O74483.1 RecName: Full=U6 snRNA-associated Sm-like protein LSm8 [Schizosaccharomyces pombe 972h-]6PPN_H Chain H, U6 snRNA-associated Sm-like protein LSm8 [Schizosaccharomyces pombe 972h-]6PPN_P Chain P, U6 snRNA-associated Sm-like protein LSm8 [Schizosaccharomyces pombe 972h-]6PPP_H Chain H, U6 snRNA-associated Sm-like protein LSm8 [Schizosaccharomyces pombe 972h-]6PPP_P Chain P, U6 snRNA-associated Sm-like protein LSm8 [S|eukprot:NP_588509.1 putative U6 snRNP-associated protein Lsm8 [Schizosaccharomyces pombe]